MNKPTKEELIRLYVQEKRNMNDIAKTYGTFRSKVSYWLKEYGIPIKDPYERKRMPEKDNLISLYESGMTIENMAKFYKSSERLISSWLKFYDVKIKNPNERVYEIPPRNVLEDYYNKNNLTIKQISQIYNSSIETVRRWFLFHNIDMRSNQRKFYHLRAVPFTQRQYEFVIGTMLGDGHLSGGKNKHLFITHCDRQLGYILYKKQIMSNYVNLLRRIERIDKRTKNLYKGWSFTSIAHTTLTQIYKMFYVNNKKIVPHEIESLLTPFALAFLIMDDGWINKGISIRISTDGFDKDSNFRLSTAIKNKFNIESKVCEYTRNDKKYYYLSFNKENSTSLSNLIEPYFTDCMRYKLVQSSTTLRQTST